MTTPQNLGKRKRPSLKRPNQDELPGFRLTTRDASIIIAVYEYRALTAPQVASLFFDGERGEVNARCKQRLRMLFQYGYLAREEQPSKLSDGRKPLVYFLDRKGAQFLQETTGSDINWHPREFSVSYPFLAHLLLANDIRTAFMVSARQHGCRIEKWLDDKMLKSPQMKDRILLKRERGGRIRAAVVPDAYFRLDTNEDRYNFFLEVDRGTVTGESSEWGRRDWQRKVKTYLEYYRTGLYQKRYGTSDMRILTVTTGEARLENLKKITEAAGGKARFWFSTYERIRGGDILTDRIWYVASREEQAALVQPGPKTIFRYKPK